METLEAQDTNHTDQAVIIAEIDGDPVIQIYQAVIIPEIVVRTQMFRLNLLSELFPLRVQLPPALAIKHRLCLVMPLRKRFLRLNGWRKLKDKKRQKELE